MTELEKIAYTKSFIDKLANGINPIDGSVIPDSDIVNNVRLSRCFFYVSDILRQIIDNGGINPPTVAAMKTQKKVPFSLTPEEAESFRFSETPISVTEIANRIIAIGTKAGVKRFPRKNLSKWLLTVGLLEYAEINGKKLTRPTPDGEAIGMRLEERAGLYGTYFSTYYNLDAQHFIIDNLEAIVSLDKKDYKEKFNLDNQGKRWTSEDDAALLTLYRSGRSVDDIALALKRGKNSVKGRLRRHGIDLDLLIATDTGAASVKEYADNTAEAVMSAADLAEEAENQIGMAETTASTENEIKETLSESVSEETASASADTCYNCKFSRSGECFPKKVICDEYERAYDIPQDERAAWPDMGDASFLRENGRRR